MPTDSESINDALVNMASNPRQAQFDGGLAISHSIPDMIKLAQHQAAQDAAAAASAGKKGFGLRFQVIKPGGCG